MLKKGVLSSFWIKIIMVALMILDHLYYFFPADVPRAFTLVGRIVAPTFVYFMAEAMAHTSDRPRYVKRMLTAGIVMQVGNTILLLLTGTLLPLNIFLSLAISAAILYYSESIRLRLDTAKSVMLLILLFAVSLFCEGRLLCPVLGLVFYYCRNNKILLCAGYITASLILVPILFGPLLPQILMVFALIPILLYNGERGPNKGLAKRFFYIIYPLHIWAFFIIKNIIK